MGDKRTGKQAWPEPGSNFWLVMAILALIIALGQGLSVLEATKITSVLFHVVLGSIGLAGSVFYFFNWRKGRQQDGPEAD